MTFVSLKKRREDRFKSYKSETYDIGDDGNRKWVINLCILEEPEQILISSLINTMNKIEIDQKKEKRKEKGNSRSSIIKDKVDPNPKKKGKG